MEEGCESDSGRVQVQPLHVLSAGHLEEGQGGHQLHPQQEVPPGHQGHVHGEWKKQYESIFFYNFVGEISLEFGRKSISKERNNLIPGVIRMQDFFPFQDT